MIDLVDFLSRHLPVARDVISNVLLTSVMFVFWLMVGARRRRIDEIKHLKELAVRHLELEREELNVVRGKLSEVDELRESLAKLDQLVIKVGERTLDGYSHLEERMLRQRTVVRAELTRFFAGEIERDISGFAFALLLNPSEDPIFDCDVDLRIDGERCGSAQVSQLDRRSRTDLRFPLAKAFDPEADVTFDLTFTDYFQRRWHVTPGTAPKEVV